MSAFLQINQLEFCFRNDPKPVLKKVSFSLEKGSITGIAGETGSGKTTLLKIIAGLLDAEKGEVLLKNEKVTGPSFNLVPGKSGIKIVAQHFDLLPDISVVENIRRNLIAFRSEFRVKKANYLLKLLGLQSQANNLPSELSGGQRQLLAIACAIAEEPEILLLDEPFSHLDKSVRTQLAVYLQRLNAELGITMILVSHDSEDLLNLCTAIHVLEKGKIIYSGTPFQAFYQQNSTYTAALFGRFSLIQYKRKQRICRPSELFLTNASGSDFKLTVSACSFQGNYYEITGLEKKGNSIVFHSQNKIDPGKIIYLQYRPKQEAPSQKR